MSRRPTTSPRECRAEAAATRGFRLERYLCGVAQDVAASSIGQWGPERAVHIVGRSPEIDEVLTKVAKIASFEEPVLITGESGVGKEAIAQAIYLLGRRQKKPFVTVNCPQFQEGNLTVSELFGHRKGSFTGAIADRKGCFEAADGGVIFLDEIGDLHMSAQVMLLRALATGQFVPLGSNDVRSVNVRVVAASNRPLEKLRIGGGFRDDLFFRLRYFHISVPALRDRGDDWRLLIEFFLSKLKAHYGVDKKYSPEAMRVLERYRWPGNVRELSSLVTMGYAMSDGELIEPQDFIGLLEHSDGQPGVREGDLYRSLIDGEEGFWKAVYQPFMKRDLNRSQVREVVRQGLRKSHGSYRDLVHLFRLRHDDYQRFMDFLRHHNLKP